MEFNDFKIDTFVDERASRYFDLFPEMSGQITVSIIEKHQFSGWHKHHLQYDQFFVARGKIKVAIITPTGDVKEEYLSEDNPKTILIPPDHWHCWRSDDETSFLIYYLSRKHDEYDEIRGTEEEIYKQYQYKV